MARGVLTTVGVDGPPAPCQCCRRWSSAAHQDV